MYALAAGRNIDLLASQILEFRPKVAVVATAEGIDRLAGKLSDSGLPRPNGPNCLAATPALVRIPLRPKSIR